MFIILIVGVSDFILQSKQETSQTSAHVHEILVPREANKHKEKIKTKHKNKTKLKERRKKTAQLINSKRKYIISSSLLRFPFFFTLNRVSQHKFFKFFSHLISKRHFGIQEKCQAELFRKSISSQ